MKLASPKNKTSKKQSKRIKPNSFSGKLQFKSSRAVLFVAAFSVVGITLVAMSLAATPPPTFVAPTNADAPRRTSVLQAESAQLAGSAKIVKGEGSNGSYVQFDDPVLSDNEKADINTQIGKHYACGLNTYSKLARITFKVKGKGGVVYRFKSGYAAANSRPTNAAGVPLYESYKKGVTDDLKGHAAYPVLIFVNGFECPDHLTLPWDSDHNFTWMTGDDVLPYTGCFSPTHGCKPGYDYHWAGKGSYWDGDSITIIAGGGLKLDAIALTQGATLGSIDWTRNDVENPTENSLNTSQPTVNSTSPNNQTSAPSSQQPDTTQSSDTSSEVNDTTDPASSVLNMEDFGKAPGATPEPKKPNIFRRFLLDPVSRAWRDVRGIFSR